MRNFTAASIAACVAALLILSGVSAHANYESSTPAKGEVLGASPAQVSITFTQDVQKITGTFGIDVNDAAGTSVTLGDAQLDDDNRAIMTVGVEPDLAPGRYVARWRNVSDSDGDDAEGAFSFYVGVQPSVEDLAADLELEGVGAEDGTPAPTAAVTPDGGETPVSSATPATQNGDEDDDGSSSGWIIVAVIIAGGIAIGFAGARWFARKKA